MFNLHTKNRTLFKHRRMKTYTDHIQHDSFRKEKSKDQKMRSIFQKAKKCYYQEGKLTQTIQYLEEYLLYRNNDSQALYLCGVSYLHLNEPIEAIRKLQKIPNNFINKENSLLLLAMAYGKIDNSQKSLEIINQCLTFFPRYQEGFCYRGKLYLKFQQFELAQKDFVYSLKLNNNSFISRAALGDCYYHQHQYEKAIKYYEESLTFLEKNNQQNKSDIILKQSICFFQTQKFHETVSLLERLQNKERNSQSYYYLGMSYLKLQKKQQGILNLQYCIRVQTNPILMQKAFKTIIQLFISDYQFYQALNILKLADLSQIQCKYWKNFVEGCMLIIKAHYKEGLMKLCQIYDILKGRKKCYNSPSKLIVENQFIQGNQKKQKVNRNFRSSVLNGSTTNKRKSFSLKHVKKHSICEDARNKTIYKTIGDRNTISRTPQKNCDIKMKRFFSSLKKDKVKKIIKPVFSQEEGLFIMPIVLKFKAYGQFFLNNYLRSLDTYEQYEAYMKNVFGSQGNQNTYNRIICQAFLLTQTQMYQQALQKFDLAVQEYQKFYYTVPIQPILYKISLLLKISLPSFFQNDQQNHSGYQYLQKVLQIQTKYDQNIKSHYLSHYFLAIMYFLCQKYVDAHDELQKTLKIVEQCTWKILYLKGSIELVLENYYDAIKQFTAGLILDQNPELYLGRAISFLLEGTKRKTKEGNHKSIRKCSIDVLNKRKLSCQDKILKSDGVNSQVFIENSFQDLQKFIQLQSDQNKISLWVTKLLFYNQAYEQASRALEKVQNKSEQLLQLQFWLKLYEGQFEQCGQIGFLIMDAFQGHILTQEQQNNVLTLNTQQINKALMVSKIDVKYSKWLIILHLFKKENYPLLVKYLQKEVFQTQNSQELLELKYNIVVAYLMHGQKSKALGILQNLQNNIQNNQKLITKIKKIMYFQFQQDECLPDLFEQIGVNGNHRLSEFLSYKLLQIKDQKQKIKRIHIKPSIPFPEFPKPNVLLKISQDFLSNELELNVVDKKIEAPWIKRNREKIQFTQQIIEAYTDFLKQTKQMVNAQENNQI